MARSPEEHHRGGGTVSGPSNLPPTDELLSTKVTIPGVRPDALVRGRLFEALDEALERKMTLVCSPAGCGKTTLLGDWAGRVKRPVAWLSLDRDDGDPARFWRYVAAALERAGVSTGERFHSLLEARGGGPSAEDLTTALVNALQVLSEDVALVLDDYHAIEARPVHDGVTFLVEHLPARLHLVVASRTPPPLPPARLRASDQIIELRAADLRFTPEESAAFLRDVWGLDLPPATVSALESRTEGWAVGLQLAALSLQNRPDPEAFVRAFTGTNRYILDYLSEQVLERQPERIRTFLLETSILERLTGPLCDAVTGRSDGERMLEELERANLFLVPLDEERRWYRLHQLFADLLRARLQQAGGARLPELPRRAAEWCERHGLIDEAIHHAIGADEMGWAGRLVEEPLWGIIGRADRRAGGGDARVVDDRPGRPRARAVALETHRRRGAISTGSMPGRRVAATRPRPPGRRRVLGRRSRADVREQARRANARGADPGGGCGRGAGGHPPAPLLPCGGSGGSGGDGRSRAIRRSSDGRGRAGPSVLGTGAGRNSGRVDAGTIGRRRASCRRHARRSSSSAPPRTRDGVDLPLGQDPTGTRSAQR